MLALFRLELLRRLVAALMLGVFLPVAGAAIACQVHCAGNELQLHNAPHHPHSEPGHDSPQLNFTKYLNHGGPCHLTAVPALAERTGVQLQLSAEHAWQAAVPPCYVSFVWPPPEHRPRA